MKIIPNPKVSSLTNAVDLTPICDSSILKIQDNTFAFYVAAKKHPILTIESDVFSLLMLRLEGRIVDINVFRPYCLCCDSYGGIVIRLTEGDGTIFQITQDDQIEICMSAKQLHEKYHARN